MKLLKHLRALFEGSRLCLGGVVGLCVLVGFAAGMRAQEPGTVLPSPAVADGERKPIPRGSVSGTVLCMDTHTPARGARVMLIRARHGTTIDQAMGAPTLGSTGLDGAYSIAHVAPGDYFVLAFAMGYLSAVDGMLVHETRAKDHDDQTAAIEAELRKHAQMVRISGAEAARADVELVRGGVLSGRIAYSDGSPATQVQVLLQASTDASTAGTAAQDIDVGAFVRAIFQQSSNIHPDDLGRFRLAGITPGSYRLAVTEAGGGGGLGEDVQALMNPNSTGAGTLTIYAGNTMHRKQAKVFEVRAGDTLDGIDIVLPLNGLHGVSGTVAGKDGVPLDAASVVLTDSADPAISFKTMVRAGEFHFAGVPEGTYDLKSKNGRTYQNAVTFDLGQEQIESMDSVLKPMHAYGETSQAVIVKDADLENVSIVPAEIALPAAPKLPPGTVSLGDDPE